MTLLYVAYGFVVSSMNVSCDKTRSPAHYSSGVLLYAYITLMYVAYGFVVSRMNTPCDKTRSSAHYSNEVLLCAYYSNEALLQSSITLHVLL